MTANDPLAQIRMQVMWNRLIAVVEEQAQTLVRSSFSTTVREAGDLSAGVFDTQGRMLAQAVTGTPGHVNSMAAAVPHFLREYPVAEMVPGDSFITNDPWIASGHLHDVTVVTPAFFGGRVVALFAATIHVVDVGGRGMGPDARQVFEEGFYIPIMHLARGGTMNQDLLKLLRANNREPEQVEGDLFSCAAAGEEGARRLVDMMEEFSLDSMDGLAEHIIAHSYDAVIAEIRKLKRGTYRYSMTTDGYDAPVTAVAALTIQDDGIDVDYTGSSPASPFGINVVLNYTAAYTTFGVKCAVAPEIPNNYGSMLPIRTTAPDGCILNVKRPAPVSARHIVGHMMPDVVLGCLHQAMAGGMPAEGSMMWNPMLRGDTWFDGSERVWEIYTFHSGGMGARPDGDGLSATAFPSGVRIIPVEAAEAVSPIIYWRKELRADSGGAGKFRGGLGQTLEIGSAVEEPLGLQAMFDRVDHPARGRDGGADGAAGVVRTASGQTLRPKGMQSIPAGERFRLELPGGAGFGDPRERAPEQLAADIEDGLVSSAAAARDYGVATKPAGVSRRGLLGMAAAALAMPHIARAATADIPFGALWPLTGAMGQSGVDSIHAVETAVDIINNGIDCGLNLGAKPGLPGLGGAKLRAIPADHQGDPQKGRFETERLITQEKVVAMSGASYSSVAAVISQVCERYGVPFVNGDSSSPSLTTHGFKTYFRPAAHDEMFSIAMFDFMDELKAKRNVPIKTAALFYEDTLFGTDSSRVQRALAAKRGIEIVADVKYRANSPSLTEEIQQVKAANPDVFMPTSYVNDAILIMKTFADLGYRPNAIIAQDSGFSEPTFVNTAGKAAEGLISRGSFALDLTAKRPAIKPVNDLFRKRSGKDLSDISSRCFTGVMVLADGINRAGSTDPKAIIAALRETNIPGEQTIMPWPMITFDAQGQNEHATPIMIQVQNGNFNSVWPFDVAAAQLTWPMPR
jgi:N-methylhydantoinase B